MGIFLEALLAWTLLAPGPMDWSGQDTSLKHASGNTLQFAEPVQKEAKKKTDLPPSGTLRGKIVMIDAERGEMMLEAEDTTHLLQLAADTAIMRGLEAVKLESLKPGDRATVFLKEEEDIGTMVLLVEVE